MSPTMPSILAPKRKADAVDANSTPSVLQPSRKRNQAAPPHAAERPAPPKLQTAIDLFYAPAEQLQAGSEGNTKNLSLACYFSWGDFAMAAHRWDVAECYYRHARNEASLDFLKQNLRPRSDGLEPTLTCRSWLLYQIGMAELDNDAPRSLTDASAHLRASQSLNPALYPASLALGVCHVLLGQHQEGAQALRKGLMTRLAQVAPAMYAPVALALGHDVTSLMSFVICLLPFWAAGQRAFAQTRAAPHSNGDVEQVTLRAAAQYAPSRRSSASSAPHEQLAAMQLQNDAPNASTRAARATDDNSLSP